MDWEYWARVMEEKEVSPLLQGAIDMHYHGYPEITLRVKGRLDDERVLRQAGAMGMRGMVIKSQMWPTMGHVYHLRRCVPEVECFSSITLNSIAGGLSPWVVEAAARQGARVVWLPTWSAAHNLGKGGFSRIMKAWFPSMRFEPGLSCIDVSGQTTPDVQSIIRLSKEMNLVLCTGHISPGESLAIAAESERIGFTRLVFTHPLADGIGATLEQTKEMARRGAYVEFCALNIFLGNSLNQMLEILAEVGTDRVILSTDAFGEWLPPAPEFLRMAIGRLLMDPGIDETGIRTMVRRNPESLLGLTPAGTG